MIIKALAAAIRGHRQRVALAAVGAVIAALSVPGVSSAASAPFPACGNPSGTANHCYVQAVMSYPGVNIQVLA